MKPVDERQRFSPHERIHVRFSYHEASRFSTDVYALLVPYLPNTCVSCECEDRSGRGFVDDTVVGGSRSPKVCTWRPKTHPDSFTISKNDTISASWSSLYYLFILNGNAKYYCYHLRRGLSYGDMQIQTYGTVL